MLANFLPQRSPSFGFTGLIATSALLGASAAWAVSIVYVRSHKFTLTVLQLAPWQTLMAAMLLLPIAFALEGPLPPIGNAGIASLAFVGPFSTAFAFWAMVEAGRHFRASTMSMALLASPTLGILISALTLGEVIGPSLIAGLLLVGTGIWLTTQRQ